MSFLSNTLRENKLYFLWDDDICFVVDQHGEIVLAYWNNDPQISMSFYTHCPYSDPTKARYTRYKFCIQVSIQVSWIQVFWSCIPYKKLESKNLNGLGWNRNASYFSFNLDGTWMEIDQSEDRILISINLWM
jgi:hypothetical protein